MFGFARCSSCRKTVGRRPIAGWQGHPQQWHQGTRSYRVLLDFLLFVLEGGQPKRFRDELNGWIDGQLHTPRRHLHWTCYRNHRYRMAREGQLDTNPARHLQDDNIRERLPAMPMRSSEYYLQVTCTRLSDVAELIRVHTN